MDEIPTRIHPTIGTKSPKIHLEHSFTWTAMTYKKSDNVHRTQGIKTFITPFALNEPCVWNNECIRMNVWGDNKGVIHNMQAGSCGDPLLSAVC